MVGDKKKESRENMEGKKERGEIFGDQNNKVDFANILRSFGKPLTGKQKEIELTEYISLRKCSKPNSASDACMWLLFQWETCMHLRPERYYNICMHKTTYSKTQTFGHI